MNRLKAKALRAQQEATSKAVVGTKRPYASILTSSTSGPNQRDARQPSVPSRSADAANARRKPHDEIQAARKFTKYVEYDFSKMIDTKGGFLTADDDPHNRALHTPNQEEKPPHMTLKEWERHQTLKKLRDARAGPFEPSLSVLSRQAGGEAQKMCVECGSLEIDWKWEEAFGCRVCNPCKERLPEKYSLLTKTEAREDYLLTDPELKDEQLLPHLERPNPLNASYNSMQLFLRYQLEAYALSDKKWGSSDALDAEFQRREAEKKKRKEEKFKAKLLDLKKRTRIDAYKRGRGAGAGQGEVAQFGDRLVRRGEKHEHEWGRPLDNEEGLSVKQCVQCGMEVEELEF